MPSNRSVVRTAARLGLGFAVLCFSLGMIELGLRPFFHPISKPWDFRVPHPSFGWSLEPGATYVYQRIGFRVAVSYNGRGWRDLPRTFEKPDGIFRVVVLGDSYMEGYSVELEEALHRQLEKRLVAARRRVEVINLASEALALSRSFWCSSRRGCASIPTW